MCSSQRDNGDVEAYERQSLRENIHIYRLPERVWRYESVTVELRQKNASSERDDTSDKTKWIMSITRFDWRGRLWRQEGIRKVVSRWKLEAVNQKRLSELSNCVTVFCILRSRQIYSQPGCCCPGKDSETVKNLKPRPVIDIPGAGFLSWIIETVGFLFVIFTL